jgi:multidrug efflux pump subunit AcrA (membrane-fusion protein)
MRHRRHPIALLLIVGSLAPALSACTQVEESESTYSPTEVTPVKGSDDIQQVTFTAGAAQRADVMTARVRASGPLTSIPYAALIYDEEGVTYTYVSPKPLVYVRERIDVDRIAGDHVVLKHGPPTGTAVVTTGAAEVYSAEFGVEE